MTLFSTLPIIPILIVLLWPLVPVPQRPRWVDFMPATALALLLLDLLIDGYQPLLLGVYAFGLILFLSTLGRLRTSAPKTLKQRGWAGLRGVMATILLAVCIIPPMLIPIHYTPAEPTGSYGLGIVTYGWEDPNRLESYTPDPADHRRIAVEIWYPTDTPQPGARALVEAPISTRQSSYPLVIFSHGATGMRSSNTSAYRELASRGYIVAAIDHTYLSALTRFPDGKSVILSRQYFSELQRGTSSTVPLAERRQAIRSLLELRIADVRFTLDRITGLNSAAEPNPLAGHVDMEHIGLAGHSMGGATAAATCRQDSRCTAAIVIDGTMSGEYDLSAGDDALIKEPFSRPLLIVYSADNYNATPEHLGYVPNINVFEHTAAPAYSLMIRGAGHMNFTDLPDRAPLMIKLMGVVLGGSDAKAGPIAPAHCTTILNSYIVAFFDQSLKGEAAPLLAGQSPYSVVEQHAHLPQQPALP